MRQLVIETGTSGLDVRNGHRIVELAAVEIIDGKLTGHNFHRFINPERSIDHEAMVTHGLTPEFLSDKPCFCDIASEFIAFIKDAELIAHNASFDLRFIDNELSLAGLGPVCDTSPQIVDTLALAKKFHPKQKNSLEALCSRYGVSTSESYRYGALLDAELLAQIYLAGFASLRLDLGKTATTDSSIWIPNVEHELVTHLQKHPKALFEISPRQFEELVAAIFRNNGFSVELTPRTRDGGVDIIAVENSAFTGNSTHLIECKRYSSANKVGIGVVQRLLGTVTQRRATKGVVVTTSSFTQDAIRVAEETRHIITLSNYNSILGWLQAMNSPGSE